MSSTMTQWGKGTTLIMLSFLKFRAFLDFNHVNVDKTHEKSSTHFYWGEIEKSSKQKVCVSPNIDACLLHWRYMAHWHTAKWVVDKISIFLLSNPNNLQR